MSRSEPGMHRLYSEKSIIFRAVVSSTKGHVDLLDHMMQPSPWSNICIFRVVLACLSYNQGCSYHFFRVSRNLKFFENVSAMVSRFELNFVHSKSVTVTLICDHIVSWSNMDLQQQQAGKDHVYIPPEYNDGLDIEQQHKI